MIEATWYSYPLVVLAGVLAGFINTLAGNGSAIVLSMLVFLGIPSPIANGTNRVGILVQSFIGYRTFSKSGMVHRDGIWWLVIPAVFGAILGASIAVELDEEMMNLALGFLMIGLLVIVLTNPKKWLQDRLPDPEKIRNWKTVVLLFFIGFHGGFVQAGVGILLIAALVLGAGYSLNLTHGTKLLIVLFFTIPAFAIFAYNGQILWFWAFLLTIGQSLGAWLAANFAVRSPNANVWVRRLLIVVILFAIVRFFELYRFFL